MPRLAVVNARNCPVRGGHRAIDSRRSRDVSCRSSRPPGAGGRGRRSYPAVRLDERASIANSQRSYIADSRRARSSRTGSRRAPATARTRRTSDLRAPRPRLLRERSQVPRAPRQVLAFTDASPPHAHLRRSRAAALTSSTSAFPCSHRHDPELGCVPAPRSPTGARLRAPASRGRRGGDQDCFNWATPVPLHAAEGSYASRSPTASAIREMRRW